MDTLPFITIQLDGPRLAECCICGKETELGWCVAYCCEPTHDEIGAESSVYPGSEVGGMAACKPCHDKHYQISN
ncbi:hypothetical protein [Phaeobacter inhibens]|uniref:hypothetical protein n=1 Tax=Phaeobacter inhibens TaxID=221822 RepID=UPI00076BB02A|nr:hypothetical protein [Phaeobacter inhibens]KXF89774.1 hypothetical protein AT574_14295 [Phaeobacter inhibens]WHP69284.1 hypothetical protein QMZ01_03600 [Phaeobacter inhibens]